jgi:agmatine deiminase
MKGKEMNGFRQPAEWDKHDAVWLAWPSAANLWETNLKFAQAEFTSFCEAIADRDPKTGSNRGEQLNILVPTQAAALDAEKALRHLSPKFFRIAFGDIWLRDIAPIFLTNGSELAAACFNFNGWGKKYLLPHDKDVAASIAKASGLKTFSFPFILEGGSIEVDGEGTCLTSRQCLLNPNRNPSMDENKIESALKEAVGVTKVLWVNDGLLNDHTDGHIDTIARYASPGKILCMQATDAHDPNRSLLEAIESDLRAMIDAKGRKIEVGLIPSPGRVLSAEGDIMPASYLNFYISNTTVIVPTYGSPQDELAVSKLATHFPTRRTIGCPAKAILSGGGAFHCISQQQPLA